MPNTMILNNLFGNNNTNNTADDIYDKLSKDVVEIIDNISVTYAIKQGRNEVTPIHVFLAVITAIKNKHDKKKKYVYKNLSEILAKYKIKPKMLMETFETMFPNTHNKLMRSEVVNNNETDDIKALLVSWAKNNNTTSDIEELVHTLFNNKSYSLYGYFKLLNDNNNLNIIVDELYSDVLKVFKLQVLEYTELSNIPELICWNKEAKYRNTKLIGMDSEIDAAFTALSCKSKKSFIFVGPAGCGKTSLVEELARRVNNGNCPENCKDLVIYEVDMTAIKAGQGLVGFTQAKFNQIIAALEKTPNVVLFMDEIHQLYSEHEALNMSNAIKPAVSSGRLTIIGATTDNEYRKHIAKDPALSRRLRKIIVHEPTDAETLTILEGVAPSYAEYHNIKIDNSVLKNIVKYGKNYAIDKANPDKSLDLLELACATTKTVLKSDTLSEDNLFKALELQYSIKASKNRYNITKKALFDKLLSQDNALNEICKVLKSIDIGLTYEDKPLAVMLYVGPTGTGKTETCKIIAEYFTGSSKNLIKVDCNDYSERIDKTKITGSAPGFVGYEDGTSLINQAKEKPTSVILFDEIEKAHKDVITTLLTAIDTGEILDNHGTPVSLKNSIIIFTSNLGYSMESMCGNSMISNANHTTKEDVLKAIQSFFKPEMLMRINKTVYFDALSEDVCKTLVERYRKQLCEKIGRNIEFNDDDVNTILSKSNISITGARRVQDRTREHLLEKIMMEEN